MKQIGLLLAVGVFGALGGFNLGLRWTTVSADPGQRPTYVAPTENALDGYANRDARFDAYEDISAGKPRYLIYGMFSRGDEALAGRLHERLGLKLEPIAGCIVSSALVNYADAYNAHIEHYIDEEFGPGTVQAVIRDDTRPSD